MNAYETRRYKNKRTPSAILRDYDEYYPALLSCSNKHASRPARAVNAIMTATYWEIGRRIVEFEQGGEARAGYGEQLLERLADDLTQRLGRGF